MLVLLVDDSFNTFWKEKLTHGPEGLGVSYLSALDSYDDCVIFSKFDSTMIIVNNTAEENDVHCLIYVQIGKFALRITSKQVRKSQ